MTRGVVAGIDLGGTAINYTFLDSAGRFLIEGLCEHPARSVEGPDVCLAQIVDGLAIAAGICDGLEFGDNAKAALITRGLAEMVRFGAALGADRRTFYGLAGLGDLVTTCNSPHSRNRSVGEGLGRGRSLSAIQDSMSAVAEGVLTAKSVHQIALEQSIDMPIATQVYRVLFENRSPREATVELMQRPLKVE